MATAGREDLGGGMSKKKVPSRSLEERCLTYRCLWSHHEQREHWCPQRPTVLGVETGKPSPDQSKEGPSKS